MIDFNKDSKAEEKARDVLGGIMGDDFVSAIYEGTTENTLTKEFDNALLVMALVAKLGHLKIENAAYILEEYNRENYNVERFKSYAISYARRGFEIKYNQDRAIKDAEYLTRGILYTRAVAFRKAQWAAREAAKSIAMSLPRVTVPLAQFEMPTRHTVPTLRKLERKLVESVFGPILEPSSEYNARVLADRTNAWLIVTGLDRSVCLRAAEGTFHVAQNVIRRLREEL